MKKRKQQEIEQILKNSKPSKAPESFVSKVMDDLNMLTNEAPLKDPQLTSLVKIVAPEQPSLEFVDKVMTKVEAASVFKHKPLIGKRSWGMILTVAAAFITYVIFSGTPSDSLSLVAELTPYLERTQATFGAAQLALQNLGKGLEMSPILAMSLTTLTVLVFVDFLFKNRRLV